MRKNQLGVEGLEFRKVEGFGFLKDLEIFIVLNFLEIMEFSWFWF
jgi:hypothetical protein